MDWTKLPHPCHHAHPIFHSPVRQNNRIIVLFKKSKPGRSCRVNAGSDELHKSQFCESV